MADTNIIGDNGERWAAIRLTQGQVFDVIELGGKTPAFDLLCRINDPEKPYQFLVQVKATETGNIFTKKAPIKIMTPVPKKKYNPLQLRPLPTYVAGVNNTNGDVYIAPAFQRTNLYGGSIPTLFHLSQGNLVQSLHYLRMIKDDVMNYWDGLDIQNYKSTFNSIII